MLPYPNIDPVAFAIGPISVRWYGLMYFIGFTLGWLLACHRAKSLPGWQRRDVDNIMTYAIIGLLLGARLGYVFFYNFSYFLDHPDEILMVWHGCMSFHGGLVGSIVALLIFARRNKKPFFEVTDLLVPCAMPGLFFGRLGNFINGELWGRVTDSYFGMVFPDPEAGLLPRHPSQLYQSLLEGLILFIILWLFSMKKKPRMAVSALFLLLYGLFRFVLEFFRQPDAQLGFVALDFLSMGQLLCLPMIIVGAVMLIHAYRRLDEKKSCP